MPFKPFNFTFTPPRTVPTPPPASTPVSTSGPTVGGPTTGDQSQAGQLISTLNDLTAMSQYLQDAILARTGSMAVEINPAVDPNTARALASIYGTDNPPNFITINMYNNLLDAHLGALQLDMAVGNNSTVQANPIQMGDLMTAVNAVEAALINNASYGNWLPLQLSSLKGDAIFFQAWSESLQTYPAYYTAAPLVPSEFQPAVIQAAGLDISADLGAYEAAALTHFCQSYSIVYQSLAGLTAVEQDANSVISEFFYQPLANVLMIISCFNALKGLNLKSGMESMQNDVINYSLIRLSADTTSMVHTGDQLVQLAVNPLKGGLGTMGRLVASAQAQASTVGHLTTGGLAGLSKASTCAQINPYYKTTGAAGKPLTIPGLGSVSAGLKALGEKLDWAMRTAEGGLSLVDKSFRQLVERRMKQQDDRNSLMCAIRALDTLLGVATGIAAEYKKGNITPNSTPQQKQEAANRILTSLQTGSNTTFTTSGDQVIVNPPDMPAVTQPVQNVLSRSKIQTTLGGVRTS